MAEKAPVSAQSFGGDEARPLPTWARARRRLEEAQVHWLATVHPDGRPHLMPVLAVWVAGALHFCAGATSRKGKDLARDPRCVITAASDVIHLVVEGEATKVRDEARLRRVAAAYASKYGWEVTVRGGALCGDGPPTAGPPPAVRGLRSDPHRDPRLRHGRVARREPLALVASARFSHDAGGARQAGRSSHVECRS